MGFLNTDSMPRLVEKLSDGDNIKITGNSKGSKVGTVVKKIVEKADDVTKAIEQEVVNDGYSFKVGTGNVDVSTDVEDGFGEVGIKGITYQNLLGTLVTVGKEWVESDNKYTLNLPSGNGQPQIRYNLVYPLKPNAKYTLICEIKEYTTGYPHFCFMTKDNRTLASTTEFTLNSVGIKAEILTTKSDVNAELLRILPRANIDNIYSIGKNIILLEGDHTNNPNLPLYFEGIVGVGDKSKNLLNPSLHDGLLDFGNYFMTNKSYGSCNEVTYSLKPNTNYTISFKKYGEGNCWIGVVINGEYSNNNNYPSFSKTITTDSTGIITLKFGANTPSDTSSKIYNLQLRESNSVLNYEPYYDGHKIEILSNGKNLFNVKEFAEKESVYYSLNEKGNLVSLKLDDRSSSFKYPIKVKPNTNYTLSTQGVTSFRVYSTITDIAHPNGYFTHTQLLAKDNVSNVTFSSGKYDSIYIKFVERANYPKEIPNIQLEESLVQTSYESHREDKTQILLNEPLMRLPNGVCDEITRDGKLIRRVGKLTLDGNETVGYVYIGDYGTVSRFDYRNPIIKCNSEIFSDRYIKWIISTQNVECCNVHYSENNIHTQILTSKLSGRTVADYKNYLRENPTTYYFELAEPIVTDIVPPTLRIFKDGHLTFNTLVAPESNHVVQLNKSAQIERSIREVQSLDSRVGKLESFYDDMMLETNHKLSLLNYDFEYTRERNGE